MAKRSVFVGRNREIAALTEFWDEARAGEPRIVEVYGPSGIGKSELVRTWLAAAAPARQVWVQALEEAAARPWAVFGRIAAALGAARTLAAVDTTDPVAAPSGPGSELVQDLTGEDLVVVVDDAQWADLASMRSLRLFARSLVADHVMILIVHTVPEPHRPGGAAVRPAFDGGWHDLFTSPNGGRLLVEGLSADDLIRLAAANRRLGLTEAGAARLHAHTGGHPRHAARLLEEVEVRIINTGRGTLPAPRNDALLTAYRFHKLSPHAQDFVAAGAILGPRFAFADAVALTRMPADLDVPVPPAAAALAEAADAGFLRAVPGSGGREVEFAEPMADAAVAGQLSAELTRRLHAAAANLGGPRALHHRVAATEGPDEDLAATLAAAAADHLSRNDIGSATAALDDVLRFTPDGPRRAARLLAAVEALLLVGDAVAAERYRDEIAAGGGDPWWDYVAGYQLLVNGRVAEARARLAAAWAAIPGWEPAPQAPADLAARIASQLAIIGLVELDSTAMTVFGAAAIGAGSSQPWVLSFARFARIAGLALAGDSAAAFEELAAEPDPAVGGLDAVVAEGLTRLWSDDHEGAEKCFRSALSRARTGEPMRIGQARGFLAEAEFRLGHLDAAVHDGEAAAVQALENGRYWDLPLLHGIACYPLAARGDWSAAETHAAESAKWAGIVNTRSARLSAVTARYILAHSRDDLRAMLQAADAMEPLVQGLETGILPYGPVRADALSRLGRTEEAAAALLPFERLVEGTARESAAMNATRVRAQIAAAEGRHAEAASGFRAARAAARRLGLPLHDGWAALRLAECHLAGGKPRAVPEVLHAAALTFSEIGAHAYVEQAQRIGRRIGLDVLTAHDPFGVLPAARQSVARLAVSGHSNAEIAQLLHVTPKTVETHLTHILRDLGGLRNRGELRDHFGRHGAPGPADGSDH